MDNKEIIGKLRDLDDLLSQFLKENSYYEEGCAQEALAQIDQVQAAVSVLPGVPSVVNAMPVFPIEKDSCEKARQDVKQSSQITLVALAAAAASVILWLITQTVLFALIGVVAGIAWFVVNKTHKNNKEVLAKKEKAYNESVARSNASFEAFHKALSSYTREVKDGMQDARAFGQLYRQKCEEHSAIVEAFGEKREQSLAQCGLLSAQIEEHDYIPAEYYHHIPTLITLLQSGRADNYKEALNMAIEAERQDAIEAERRAEEDRRIAAMERQAEEERRHNMMMEQQQAAHDREMERAANAQVAEQRRANAQAEKDRWRAEIEARNQRMAAESEARKQANATRVAGVSKCASCKNSRRCPSDIKNNGSGLTCGGYEPY